MEKFDEVIKRGSKCLFMVLIVFSLRGGLWVLMIHEVVMAMKGCDVYVLGISSV